MTGGIVFILHGAAEVHYAGNVARALSAQCTAVPVPVAHQALQIGTGATCVVVWSPSPDNALETVVSSFGSSRQNCLLCVFEGASVPASLQHLPKVHVKGIGFAGPDGEILAEALRRQRANSEAEMTQSNRSLRSPALNAKPSSSVDHGKGQFVVRSAWGFAATMAVVTVVVPFIGARAGAADITPDPNRSSADISADGRATVERSDFIDTEANDPIDTVSYSRVAAVVPTSAVEAPARSLEMALPPSAANDGAFELVLASTAAATDNIEVAISNLLDVKAAETIAGMAAANDEKIDDVSLSPQHDEKSQPSREPKIGSHG